MLLCVPVCFEQWPVSVVSAAGVRAGICCLLLQCRKTGAAPVGIYSSGAAECSGLHCVSIDPAGSVDWAQAEATASAGVGADFTETAHPSNRKTKEKLGEESPVYIICTLMKYKRCDITMERKNTGVFVKLAIFALAVFAVISIVYLQLTINEERTKRDSLKAEVSALEEERDALQNQVDAPMDEEYIIDIAKEKLNLRLPEEIIFYNNLYN